MQTSMAKLEAKEEVRQELKETLKEQKAQELSLVKPPSSSHLSLVRAFDVLTKTHRTMLNRLRPSLLRSSQRSHLPALRL